MTLIIEFGWLAGHAVRRARNSYQCEYWRGSLGRCEQTIKAGDWYVEGEPRGDGSPFAMKRYCLACAPDGRVALHISDARAFGQEARYFATHGGAWITASNAARSAAHLAFMARPDLRQTDIEAGTQS